MELPVSTAHETIESVILGFFLKEKFENRVQQNNSHLEDQWGKEGRGPGGWGWEAGVKLSLDLNCPWIIQKHLLLADAQTTNSLLSADCVYSPD